MIFEFRCWLNVKLEMKSLLENTLRWVQTLIKPFAEIDPKERLQSISSGCACRIVSSVGTSVKWESDTKGDDIIPNIWLQPSIQWSIIDPGKLFGVTDDRSPSWRTSRSEPTSNPTNVIVGNLPGMATNKSGSLVPISAFEYRVHLQVKDLIPFVPVNAIVAYDDDEVFVRHKKRWKYPLPLTQGAGGSKAVQKVLDFTQTRQGETQNELQSSPFKFEIEMEQSFSISDGKRFDPVEETIGSLKAVASILFTTSIPKPGERVVSAWRSLPPPKKLTLYTEGEKQEKMAGFNMEDHVASDKKGPSLEELERIVRDEKAKDHPKKYVLDVLKVLIDYRKARKEFETCITKHSLTDVLEIYAERAPALLSTLAKGCYIFPEAVFFHDKFIEYLFAFAENVGQGDDLDYLRTVFKAISRTNLQAFMRNATLKYATDIYLQAEYALLEMSHAEDCEVGVRIIEKALEKTSHIPDSDYGKIYGLYIAGNLHIRWATPQPASLPSRATLRQRLNRARNYFSRVIQASEQIGGYCKLPDIYFQLGIVEIFFGKEDANCAQYVIEKHFEVGESWYNFMRPLMMDDSNENCEKLRTQFVMSNNLIRDPSDTPFPKPTPLNQPFERRQILTANDQERKSVFALARIERSTFLMLKGGGSQEQSNNKKKTDWKLSPKDLFTSQSLNNTVLLTDAFQMIDYVGKVPNVSIRCMIASYPFVSDEDCICLFLEDENRCYCLFTMKQPTIPDELFEELTIGKVVVVSRPIVSRVAMILGIEVDEPRLDMKISESSERVCWACLDNFPEGMKDEPRFVINRHNAARLEN